MTEIEAVSPRFPRWLGIPFVLYIALTIFLALHHEARADEAHTWLLMRDGGVRVMLSRTGYLGQPALWYLVLAPFASAGLPYLAQQVVNLLMMWFAMGLFILRAPFSLAVRVLFLFSFYPVAEYAVDARAYSLLIALLFGIAASWQRRHEHPLPVAILTALLANTTPHGLLIAAVIGAVFLGEALERRDILRRPAMASVFIMLAGGIASALQLWPPADGQKVSQYVDPGTVPYVIGSAFLPGVDPRLSFVVGLILLLLAVLAIGDRVGALLFIALSLSALLLLFVYVWFTGAWHTGLILMVVLAGVWMADADQKEAEPWRRSARRLFEGALAVCLAWGIYQTAREGIADTKWAYSGSRDMAAYISKHVPQTTIIAAHAGGDCASVLVYLPGRRLWLPAEQRYGSYATWDRAFQRGGAVPLETAAQMAQQQLGGQRWLLLANMEIPRAQQLGFRLLYTNQQIVYSRLTERLWLYAPDGHLPAE